VETADARELREALETEGALRDGTSETIVGPDSTPDAPEGAFAKTSDPAVGSSEVPTELTPRATLGEVVAASLKRLLHGLEGSDWDSSTIHVTELPRRGLALIDARTYEPTWSGESLLVDTATGRILDSLPGFFSATFSEQGDIALLAHRDFRFSVLDLESRTIRTVFDASALAVAAPEAWIKEVRFDVAREGQCGSVIFGGMQVFDLSSGALIHSCKEQVNDASWVEYDFSGSRYVVSPPYGNPLEESGEAVVYATADGSELGRFSLPRSKFPWESWRMTHCKLGPEGRRIFLSDYHQLASVDIATGVQHFLREDPTERGLTVAGSGTVLVRRSNGENGPLTERHALVLIDAISGDVLERIQLRADPDEVSTHGSRELAVTTDGQRRVYPLDPREQGASASRRSFERARAEIAADAFPELRRVLEQVEEVVDSTAPR
jgi:hypothetical protein